MNLFNFRTLSRKHLAGTTSNLLSSFGATKEKVVSPTAGKGDRSIEILLGEERYWSNPTKTSCKGGPASVGHLHWRGFHPVLFRCLKSEEREKEKVKKEKPIIKTNINPKVC
jgi:hypothetical protein